MGAYFVTLSGDFATLSVGCYIIGKFGVLLWVDVTFSGVVILWPANLNPALVPCSQPPPKRHRKSIASTRAGVNYFVIVIESN